MTRPADTPPLGAVVADLGANLICVLVILIAIAALKSAPDQATAPQAPIAPIAATPLSGAAQSDLLHHRLRPPPDLLLIEVRASGAFAIGADTEVPLGNLAPPYPTRAALFVFSPAAYDATRRQLSVTGVTVQEMTVPLALRGSDGFSRAFLTLRVTDDPQSIREPLLRLLTAGGSSGAWAGDNNGAQEKSTYSSIFIWLRGVLYTTLNLIGGVVALFTLRAAYRRR